MKRGCFLLAMLCISQFLFAQEMGHFSSVKEALEVPDEVISLDISGEVPGEDLEVFTSLVELRVSDTNLKEELEFLKGLPSLRRLDFVNCRLDGEALLETLAEREELIHFGLVNCSGKKGKLVLGEGLWRLNGLASLDLQGSKLADFPGEPDGSVALQALDLRNTGLPAFPAFLASLKSLEVLRIGGREIPAEFQADSSWMALSGLGELREVEVVAVPLEEIPPVLLNRQELRVLRVSGAKLKGHFVAAFPGLEELYLEGCDLRVFPAELAELEDLKRLSLRGNGLSSVPPEIGTMNGLRWLDLRGNSLLPEAQEVIWQWLPGVEVVF